MKQICKEAAIEHLVLDDVAIITNELQEQGNSKKLYDLLDSGWRGYESFSSNQLQYLIDSRFPNNYKIKD
jgi:hypothetical protein